MIRMVRIRMMMMRMMTAKIRMMIVRMMTVRIRMMIVITIIDNNEKNFIHKKKIVFLACY